MTVKIDGSNGLLANYDYQTPTTGFTYTFTTYNVLFAVPAGTLATGTVTMSAAPVDGTMLTITSTQQITALTINANTGQSIIGGGAVQLNANTSRQYMYRAANTTWYLQNIAAGNVVTSVNGSTGAVTITSGGGKGQTFTANGTFTIPTGVTAVKVTVVGGGASGGASNACYGAGGGGGGGGAAIKYLTSLTPGNTLAVTVGGAGSTSSVASGTQSISTISATGGSGGGSGGSPNGGAGGLGSGGDINIGGGGGGSGASNSSGTGGSSILGGGGSGSNFTGGAGRVYGGGGAGGGSTTGPAGAGAAGVVMFEW